VLIFIVIVISISLFSFSRYFTPSAVVYDLPYHVVVGMPALSPTMETGVLAEWYVAEGVPYIAGAALAKIETDKASMDFEAQDDGVIAKYLMEAGTGADIPVNTPIMVTVEELEDAAAFSDYSLPVVEEAAPVAPEPVAAPPAPKVEAVAPPPPPAPVAPPAPVVAAEVPPPAMEALVAAVAPVMSTGWGEFAKINSPIAKTLSKQQNDYVGKYGTTGQVPL
jgi:pyruvate dehydrogenase E2 component (dihydrolipoamide acetyltransferase)